MYASCSYWPAPVVRWRAIERARGRKRRIAGEEDEGGWGWLADENGKRKEWEKGAKRKGGRGMKYPLINTPNCTDPSLQSPPGLHVHREYAFSTLNVRLVFGRKELYSVRSRENGKFKRFEKKALQKRNTVLSLSSFSSSLFSSAANIYAP